MEYPDNARSTKEIKAVAEALPTKKSPYTNQSEEELET